MYTGLVFLVVFLAICMCLIVLIQESKGGGLASSFSASNQIMGVRKTTDLIEKVTWTLAIAIVVFSIASSKCIPAASVEESAVMRQATEQKATNSNNLPGFNASQTQQNAPTQQAPAAAPAAGAAQQAPAAPAQ